MRAVKDVEITASNVRLGELENIYTIPTCIHVTLAGR
jgi:hypothetical protein